MLAIAAAHKCICCTAAICAPTAWPRAAEHQGQQKPEGRRIYHVPGMPYYESARPEEVFCTEAEARAAGYRRAIVKENSGQERPLVLPSMRVSGRIGHLQIFKC